MNDRAELFLYSKPGCSACDKFKARLDEYSIPYYLIDISQDPELLHRYGARIPVLVAGNREICEGVFDKERVFSCC